MKAAAKRTPEINSMMGYRIENLAPQFRHFPFKINQDKIGMLSFQEIIFWQLLHRLRGATTLSPFGHLRMMTLPKLPKIAPRQKKKPTASSNGMNSNKVSPLKGQPSKDQKQENPKEEMQNNFKGECRPLKTLEKKGFGPKIQ